MIEFFESKLPDGYVQVSWKASTRLEWESALESIKAFIPTKHRLYVAENKSWTISPEFIDTYEKIKRSILDGESLSDGDFDIFDIEIIKIYSAELYKLPKSMKSRAVFALKACLGILDVPYGYCYSDGTFGAYDQEKDMWVYTDGRYSHSSPKDKDKKALDRSYKSLSIIKSHLDNMDKPYEWAEKQAFRLNMLEKYGHECYVCTSCPNDTRNLHMHRVLPGNMGGQYIESNVVILCSKCHRRLEGLSWDAIESSRRELQNA